MLLLYYNYSYSKSMDIIIMEKKEAPSWEGRRHHHHRQEKEGGKERQKEAKGGQTRRHHRHGKEAIRQSLMKVVIFVGDMGCTQRRTKENGRGEYVKSIRGSPMITFFFPWQRQCSFCQKAAWQR
jgi:hypothetical protein